MSTQLYKKNDIVKHTSKFLRNTGWYTNVPINGQVTEDQEEGSELVRVQWCDREESVPINAANIMPFNKPDYS